MKKIIFHVHSSYSYDSNTNPQKIVDFAMKNNVSCLVITDHDSLAGSISAKKYATRKKLNIEIPISAEYLTDIGEIIAVDLPKKFKNTFKHKDLCRAIKKEGGYTILPHPFRGHQLNKIDYTNIDYIEVFNSRSSFEKNKNALLLAEKKKKKKIYGSDAHFLKTINNVITVYNKNNPFDDQIEPLHLKCTNKNKILFSQLIKARKTKNLKLFIISIMRIIKYYSIKIIRLIKNIRK